mgnify:CR=1 FL=1
MQLKVTSNTLDKEAFWTKPVPFDILNNLSFDELALFDQNGYDMSRAEQIFSFYNGHVAKEHRHRSTNKQVWMVDEDKSEVYAHINHCDIYQRRGFAGDALEQLQEKAKKMPVYYKLIRMQPKWGVDISIDYVDTNGNVFELMHFEWDDVIYGNVMDKKYKVELIIANTDWDSTAKEMLERKKEWIDLDFFSQSSWKQQFWGLPKEQFKEVIWY